MGTKQASEKWGYSQGTISNWCRQGMIQDAEQKKFDRIMELVKQGMDAVGKERV